MIFRPSIVSLKKESVEFVNGLKSNDGPQIFEILKGEYYKKKNGKDFNEYSNRFGLHEHLNALFDFFDVLFSEFSEEDIELLFSYYVFFRYSNYYPEYWFTKPCLPVDFTPYEALEDLLFIDEEDVVANLLMKAELNYEYRRIKIIKETNNLPPLPSKYKEAIFSDTTNVLYLKRWT